MLEYIKSLRLPPTIRELMERFDIHSPNGVVCHLWALRHKGYITWQDGKARTIVAVEGI